MNDKHFPAKEVNAYIKYWQNKLSLGNWEIDWCVGNEYSDAVKDQCKATVGYNSSGRVATITLSPFCRHWRASIRHEMLEILIVPLCNLIKDDDKECAKASHEVIRRLEKILK
jgi:hypothetical protein